MTSDKAKSEIWPAHEIMASRPAQLVDTICDQCGETVNSRKITSRCVLNGMHNLFHQVVLKCIFMFKSNRLCKSEKTCTWYCFSGIEIGPEGTGKS